MKLIHNKHTYRLWGSAFKTSGNRDLHIANGILKLVTESGSVFEREIQRIAEWLFSLYIICIIIPDLKLKDIIWIYCRSTL
jgi:hypothetical protein